MNQLDAVLANLAEKFNVSVEHLWTVVVTQAKITVITNGALSLIFTILLGVCLYAYRWIYVKFSDDGEGVMFLHGVNTLILLVIVLSLGLVGETFFTALLNPEFWALKQILRGGCE
jgi:hypothetical protein